MSEAAVQVAVRIRPFNGREKSMNAKRCIEMEDQTTYIYEEDVDDADGDPRLFSFDYSMWSHFDFNTTEGGENPEFPGRPNVDQSYAYSLIGIKLLNYMWEGYDVCMFAYGQSGAGKSFSMTGTGPKCAQKWKGIIPRIAADTFTKAGEQAAENENVSFKITASMLEIYVGKIFDLLIRPEDYNIKTRQELDMQMDTVAGLSTLPVSCEDDVTDLLVRGFGNQTKAPTGLNVDSSRGHTIFTLDVNKLIKNPKAKKKAEKQQVVHTAMRLVDLAGSERTEKVLEITKEQLAKLLTEKYGKTTKVTDKMMTAYKSERTTEGRSINNSLTTLGNCVKQVAKVSEISDLKKRAEKMKQIAWRSSSLTRLLRTALNGKCKTIMIAAVSPSLTEYPETLSTMRYANQIKAIKSTAKKKEAKLTAEQLAMIKIKELEEKLAAALAGGGGGGGGDGGGGGGGADPEAMKQLQEQMEEMKRKEAEMKRKEAEYDKQMKALKEQAAARKAIRDSGPHVLEILNNPMTSGLVPTAIAEGEIITAGVKDSDMKMKLRGTGVKNHHCNFTNEGGKCTLVAVDENAQCMVNGQLLTEPRVLEHNDRIRLAENNYFRFMVPDVLQTKSTSEQQEDDEKYTYEFMREEALRELVEGFSVQDEEEDRKRKELDEKLKVKEAEYEKKKAELEAKQKADEEAAMAKFKAMQEELDEQKKKAEEMMGNATEAEKANLAAENAATETAMREKIEREKAEIEKALLEHKLDEEKKLKAEKEKEQKDLRKQQEEARQKDAEKSRIQYDLMDAIPACRQANACAKDLGFKCVYEVKLISDQTPTGLKNEVCIQLSDESGAQELWKIDKFRSKFGTLMQQYYDNKAAAEQGLPIDLPHDSPYMVSHHALQVIGHAKIMLNYIYYNMEVQDAFHIVSYTGQIAGDVKVVITPIWTEQQQAELDDTDNLSELTSLRHLDLQIEVKSCSSLPPKFASDVRIEYNFPDFITNSLLPEDGSDLPARQEDEDEEDYDNKWGIQRGGAHMTPFNADTEGKLNINPDIMYKRVVRIHEVGKKQIKWFELGELVLTVMGEIPDELGAKTPHNAGAGAVGGGGGGGKDREIAELKAQISAEQSGGDGGAASLAKQLEDEKKARQKFEKELAEAKQQLAAGGGGGTGDLEAMRKELEAKITKLEKERDDALNQKSSGACTLL